MTRRRVLNAGRLVALTCLILANFMIAARAEEDLGNCNQCGFINWPDGPWDICNPLPPHGCGIDNCVVDEDGYCNTPDMSHWCPSRCRLEQ